MSRPGVCQHGNVDLSLENVEQLVTFGMTFPRWLPGIAPHEDAAFVERRELRSCST
jgi:hypothetical protein